MRIAINGFGRIGRLVFRRLAEAADGPELVAVNDPGGDADNAAYLAEFDTVHGRWPVPVAADGDALVVDGRRVAFTGHAAPGDWARDADVVIECSGRFKDTESLAPYLEAGVGHVIVSAPVGDASVPNVVVGVNDDAFDPGRDRIVSGASCTTNCVAPVVSVLHGTFGLVHGSIDTIHAVTPSQKVLDGFAKDVRRGRAGMSSLIPTSTGAAKAVVRIFPELEGRLSGLAVRVPVTNPSITDCTFELSRATDAEAVNGALREAAEGPLAGILGFEDRPLVSVDYTGDPRSSIVDGPSTIVVDGTHVKVLAWYDNETGYSRRLVDLLGRLSG
jgi:glyceraldehyde 3-phosphate dehydrogenase